MLNDFGVDVSVKQLLQALKKLSPWLINIWETNKDVTHLDQIRFIVKTASRDSIVIKEELLRELTSAYVSPLFEVPPYLNPDARRVLQWLKDRNKLIGLICNTGRTPGFGIRRFLEKVKVANFFDLMLFSDEVGIRKPDPRIFQLVVKKLDVKPHEVIHIGDNLKSDVWGAKNAGLNAIHFLTVIGRDDVAESDPTSLVSFSRELGSLKEKDIVPDRTITSLGVIIKFLENLEK